MDTPAFFILEIFLLHRLSESMNIDNLPALLSQVEDLVDLVYANHIIAEVSTHTHTHIHTYTH